MNCVKSEEYVNLQLASAGRDCESIQREEAKIADPACKLTEDIKDRLPALRRKKLTNMNLRPNKYVIPKEKTETIRKADEALHNHYDNYILVFRLMT